jgi:hypothetical protein
MKNRSSSAIVGRHRGPSRAFAVLLACGCASASAIELETGNPDLRIRWDNTVRYNLGVRTESQDPRLMSGATYDEGDSKFKAGDIVTNRVDLLSEFDVNYRSQFGARVSAAAWYDDAYKNHGVTSTAPGGVPTSYFNNTYNSSVSRYVNGPSGEILDAFVWTNFNLGETPVNIKLGRHTLVWGEGLLLGGHAISYSQSPSDGVKAVTSPGIETKEVFLPLNQISAKAQVTNDLTLAAQYFLEWKPTRVPNAGTYLMGADTTPNVERLGAAPGFALLNSTPNTPGNRGNWGVSARLNVEAIESTLGLYYRKFDDYAPETGIQMLGPAGPFRFTYTRDVKLIGASIARPFGPVAFGADISLRKDAHLNSATTYDPLHDTGARGDTLHAVINGLYGLPKTAFWDTGTIIAELGYSRLQRITQNPGLYRGVGYGGCIRAGTTSTPGNVSDACSTRDNFQLAVNFTPQYLSVLPSWDLELPMSINYGLKGSSPASGGGFEHLLTWAVGVKMTYLQRHEFTLRYSDLSVPTKYNAAGTAIGGNALNSSVGATDRAWLVFTYKTSF